MNSVRRLCFPLLGALGAFLMVPSISSAATVTLGELVTKTFFLNEGGFDHDPMNPLQITISDATWGQHGSPPDVGALDIRVLEPAGGHVSDLIRLVNVNGMATIYFGSDNAGVSPATGPLSGPLASVYGTFTEGDRFTEFTVFIQSALNPQGYGIDSLAVFFKSDSNDGGSISDHITFSLAPNLPRLH